ncbi:FecR family protein [Bordetella sp. LUAb4]|uniref:FecR family protein n=1 Tax=Bordetella sp. LUAb4 TaxID=2843195 RepID=UPI001E3CFBF2|nr:FecR domain-containing protein [Bordetella sp. LUAb4]
MLSLPQDVPPALLEHALILLARQQGGTPAAARKAEAELARWRNESAQHELAFQLAQEAWAQTEAPGLREHIALPRAEAAKDGQGRRRALTAALGVSALFFTSHWLRPWSDRTQSFATARGQIRSEMMADGTRVDLGALTSLTVRLAADAREVVLDQGEARFSVAGDVNRPFLVHTRWGSVRVVGTEFSVRTAADATYVEVAEGLVRVQADWQGTGSALAPAQTRSVDSVELGRGDAIRMDRGGLGVVARIDPANVGAWRNGWLVFDGDNLVSAVQRWNDYTSASIGIVEEDRAVLQRLRITGGFSINDRDAFLKSLPRILPVRVAVRDGQTRVGRR